MNPTAIQKSQNKASEKLQVTSAHGNITEGTAASYASSSGCISLQYDSAVTNSAFCWSRMHRENQVRYEKATTDGCWK